MLNRMLGLLRKAYAVHVLSGSDPTSIRAVSGVVLIDEAENHLHPQWQRKLIPIIKKHFPNLQLIVATHSPFVLSSVSNARVYVCSADSKSANIKDYTADYANRPVDEILASPVFGETRPFNLLISELLDIRKKAIVEGDVTMRKTVEAELIKLNPDYFAYFDIEAEVQKLKELNKGAAQ